MSNVSPHLQLKGRLECTNVNFSQASAGRAAQLTVSPQGWHTLVRWGPQTAAQQHVHAAVAERICDVRNATAQGAVCLVDSGGQRSSSRLDIGKLRFGQTKKSLRRRVRRVARENGAT